MMKTISRIAAVAVAAAALAGCMVTIPNPFGGAPLVLTGNLSNDMPSILAYETAVKQGVATDIASAQQFLLSVCPSVSDVQTAVANANPSSISSTLGITVTAAQKQISNVSQGVQLASTVCAGGTATDWKTAASNFVTAAKIVYGWFASKPVTAS